MEPPWIAIPDIPRFSAGWRMGGGEDYKWAFWEMFQALSPGEQEAYELANPEPEGWTGYYDQIRRCPLSPSSS
jgi:hypothetical protein